MSAAAKKLVQSFFESDSFSKKEVYEQFVHPDLEVYWHSSTGYNVYDFASYWELIESASLSYESIRYDVSHILSEKDEVAVRYTLYSRTIENPGEEVPIGYFISIWEVKDGKLATCHQTSYPAI
ncbi:SnoaL-like domain-containing protein [Nonlabens sp. Hel1_33_55]|uniref:nuclear transport factor 2 family protein n=1 Tax=Nonlabens sp. Hel1_33_55 TaxID=1336802 RepID=UPI000875C883|nr:nuclear transport factor 2 family protein [Nonlabens sp. Hel1_33_55]SCY03009.1 SnoaL-like domain-containing protein [Nonlabens sp. Hel1_33_55]